VDATEIMDCRLDLKPFEFVERMEAAFEVGREEEGVCGAGRLDCRDARERCREGVEGSWELDPGGVFASDARLYWLGVGVAGPSVEPDGRFSRRRRSTCACLFGNEGSNAAFVSALGVSGSFVLLGRSFAGGRANSCACGIGGGKKLEPGDGNDEAFELGSIVTESESE